MDTTIEIPLSKSLKKQAETASRWYGFSSLTEALEALIQKLSRHEISLEKGKEVRLSKRAIKRYDAMTKDFEQGKNVYHAKDIDDFIKQLSS
ncbi:MAG: hypothetical protein HY429_04315 [Candidatus Levybacteria bacterium]|nr:hypothetical protein [Candidatus Levybacteria bacterium]